MKNAPVQTANESAQDSADFIPTYPKLGTQSARLLAVLLHGGVVNPLFAWRTLGIYRLSDTVYQLRGMGWPVATDRLSVPNRFNEMCHVALYRLDGWAIEKAGQAGRDYASMQVEVIIPRRAA